MSIFKCKMCGGTLEIQNNESVAVCEYCGTKQTIPRLDTDKRANLYDRANHFRRNNEFDKALSIYEQILNDDGTDAEAYWSIVLCRYGIEYVEDPATHKRVPTVNRAQFTSIFDDDNYKLALQYADGYQCVVYEEEAKTINEIQKGILEISQKEEPFDVFICYKETDDNGRRTEDSVLAYELYRELTREGLKVFYARITLEDKLGTAYEPYIFAALNSSKVMVVLGTKREHFTAVWVQNEWSRYLSLIRKGERKMLIPAYKGMDPYDMPEEFSHLQAQDMEKLGFMQDLVHGIQKIVGEKKDIPYTQQTVLRGSNIDDVLLKQAFISLENRKWEEADDICTQKIALDSQNGMAYLGKLMAELKCAFFEDIKNVETCFADSGNYRCAISYLESPIKDQLIECLRVVTEKNEYAQRVSKYVQARKKLATASTSEHYIELVSTFKELGGFEDSAELVFFCEEKAEMCHKEEIYAQAMFKMKRKRYAEAIELLASIPDQDGVAEKIGECEQRFKNNLKKRKRAKIATVTFTIIIAILVMFTLVLKFYIIPQNKYDNAVSLMNEGKYRDAIAIFDKLNGYSDSVQQFNKCLKEILKHSEIGDAVHFGSYEQDGNIVNGPEKIEWIVLDQKEGKILVVSKYALACKPYNTDKSEVTWETCTLRKWLNNEFVESAFSVGEKTIISIVTVSADENPKYTTDPGNATQDKVFLLSQTEVNQYFDSIVDRQCTVTEYAVDEYTGTIGNHAWWLRSPGQNSSRAVVVYGYGGSDEIGRDVVYRLGVRPAMWIDLNA